MCTSASANDDLKLGVDWFSIKLQIESWIFLKNIVSSFGKEERPDGDAGWAQLNGLFLEALRARW